MNVLCQWFYLQDWQICNIISFLDFIRSLLPVFLQKLPFGVAIEYNDFLLHLPDSKWNAVSNRISRDCIQQGTGTNFTGGEFINEHFHVMLTPRTLCNHPAPTMHDNKYLANKGTLLLKAVYHHQK